METRLRPNLSINPDKSNANIDKLRKSAEKLASGKRINKASDDPAGLIISEKMRAHIAAIEQELKQIDNRINRLEIADERLHQMGESLIRIRELVITAANESTVDQQSLAAINQAIEYERRNFNRLAEEAAADNIESQNDDGGSADAPEKMAELAVSDATDATRAIETIDRKLIEVNRIRGEIGAEIKNKQQSRREELLLELGNLSSARSAIVDVDMAAEFAHWVNQKIVIESQLAFRAQTKPTANLVSRLLGV